MSYASRHHRRVVQKPVSIEESSMKQTERHFNLVEFRVPEIRCRVNACVKESNQGLNAWLYQRTNLTTESMPYDLGYLTVSVF